MATIEIETESLQKIIDSLSAKLEESTFLFIESIDKIQVRIEELSAKLEDSAQQKAEINTALILSAIDDANAEKQIIIQPSTPPQPDIENPIVEEKEQEKEKQEEQEKEEQEKEEQEQEKQDFWEL